MPHSGTSGHGGALDTQARIDPTREMILVMQCNRDLRIINADSGIFLSGTNITVTPITLTYSPTLTWGKGHECFNPEVPPLPGLFLLTT